MQVGTTQSQSTAQSYGTTQIHSLVASLSITTQIEASGTITKEDGSTEAVMLSIGRTIDISYAEQVIQTELGDSFANALSEAGIDTQDLEDALSGATDFSPEATAKRIVDFATSFLGAFKGNHLEQEGNAQIDGFSQLIKDAVDEGSKQSRDLLEGIGRISSQVTEEVDRTYRLVMQGIDDFSDRERAALAAPEEVVEEPLVI